MRNTSIDLSGLTYALRESTSVTCDTGEEAIRAIHTAAGYWHSRDNNFDRFLAGHPFDSSSLNKDEEGLPLSEKLELYRKRFIPKTTSFFRDMAGLFKKCCPSSGETKRENKISIRRVLDGSGALFFVDPNLGRQRPFPFTCLRCKPRMSRNGSERFL